MHWSEVPILECGQPLSRLMPGPRIFVEPAYRRIGLREALDSIWLRRGALELLGQAAQMLPPARSLVVLDGWRPLALQQRLYDDYSRDLAAQTGLEGQELHREVTRYVAFPSDQPSHPSPHLTGGAVDLTLGDEQGRPLDMGGQFDELAERSATRFYEDGDPDHALWRDARRLLCAVMAHVGFSNNPAEWWHFDVGNQAHHARVGGVARFGAVLGLPR